MLAFLRLSWNATIPPEDMMIVSDLHDVGRLVRQRRQDAGLSQSDLAARAGVTRQLLSRFEQGKSDLPLSTALRMLRELSISVDMRTRAERASVIEVRMPTVVPPRLQVPRLDPAALRAVQTTIAAMQANTARALEEFARVDLAGLLPRRGGNDARD